MSRDSSCPRNIALVAGQVQQVDLDKYQGTTPCTAIETAKQQLMTITIDL